MDVGVMLPVWAASVADARANVHLARRAEELGFESVWLGDHLVQPPHLAAFGGVGQLEAITMMGAIAVATDSIAVGTCVLVPLRHPLHVFAAFGTLADLAPGRIRLGAGGGVLEPEFDALGSPFRARGARLDDTFALLRDWPVAEQLPDFEGLPGWATLPRPGQPVELWVGGSVSVGRKPLRRAATFGDGWFPAYPTVEAYAETNAELDRQLDEAGRARSSVRRSALFWCCLDEDGETARAAARQFLGAHYERSQSVRLDESADRGSQGEASTEAIVAAKQLVGTPDEVAARLRDYQLAGLDHAVIGFLPVEGTERSLELFQRSVAPQLDAPPNGSEVD